MRKPLPFATAACLRGLGAAAGLLWLAPAVQAQTFTAATSYNAGNNANPLSVAVADLNGDGRRDIITGNNGSSMVGVLLNNGTGTFGTVATTSTGTNSMPNDLAVADLNNDGRIDVITTNLNTNAVGVLLGNGNGTLQAVVPYSTGANSQPYGLAVADVNADGRPDIITTNGGTQTIGVLLNSGSGTFPTQVTYSTGSTVASYVAVGDVNADGRPDLVAALNTGVGILLGSGSGAFQGMTTIALTNRPGNLALADVNADNKLDIVSVSTNNNYLVQVQLGNGNGTFAAAVSYATGSNSYPSSVAVADVSGDGKPDLITANTGNYTVGVFRNNGNGTFAAVTSFALPSNSMDNDLAVVDVSNDGKPDIVTANFVTNTVSVLLNTSTFLATRPAALAAEVQLTPNPASAAASFTAAGLPAEVRQVEATLLNALGQPVGRATAEAAQGTARAGLPTAGLAAGLYLLHLDARDLQGAVVGTLPTQRLEVR